MLDGQRISSRYGHDLLVIQERGILLWVEHFEQRTGWISIMSLSNLVDFINQDQGVLCCDLLQCLNRFTRHSTTISCIPGQLKRELTRRKSFGDP